MRTLSHRREVLLGRICLFLVFAGFLLAQGTSGNITGQVFDTSKAAVPSAKVVATNTATNVNTTTTSTPTGSYNLIVYPGTYQLSAEVQGFKRYVRDNITVTAGSTVRLDPVLELGSMTESIQVSGTLLTVQSENAKISTAVENKFVDELPLMVSGAMRNPYDLAQVAAQVTKRGVDDVSVGGSVARSFNATLDGLSILTNRSAEGEVAYMAPSLEAITELGVDTGGFKAEYGQAAGGNVTFSSKSGTNKFHGTAFDFLRNEKLDARAFFEDHKSVYRQNNFGAAGGGPVIIPKIYNGQNRTFFYGTYEGFRNRTGSLSVGDVGSSAFILSVPTPEMYQGDFSNWVNANGQLLPIYDPSTTRPNPSGSGTIRDAFPNNRIPTARFSQFSKVLIPYGQVVKPNRGAQPGTIDYIRSNFIKTSGSYTDPQNKYSVKIDHELTDSHRLGFFMTINRANHDILNNDPPGLPLPLSGNMVDSWNSSAYRMTYDWLISPTMLNHFQVGGNLYINHDGSPNYTNNWKDKVCMPNAFDCNRNFAQTTFSEFAGWGGSAINGTEQPMWSLKDDFSYTRGRHTFKTGFQYQKQIATQLGEQPISGVAGFSFLETAVPGDTSFRSGSSFASFLLGEADSGSTATPRDVAATFHYFGSYLQDDWRISDRLTLNLGVRYDFTLPPREARDQNSDFTPDRPNPAVNNFPGALRYAGFGPGRENTRSLVGLWHGGIGPRLGLAYTLNRKTTLRTGIGRSFDRQTVSRGGGHFGGFIGSYSWNSLDQGITPAFNWDRGLPAYPLPITIDPKAKLDPAFSNNQGTEYWQPKDAARASESFYWSFNLQREIAANTLLELGYSANIGTHLMAGLVNMNQVPTAIWNGYVQKYGATGALNLLRADINSTLARSAGVPIPYPNFTDPTVQSVRTVAQALRPWPQYNSISTNGVGDKSGHSSYHSAIVKFTRRYSNGLALEWNYVFSKLLSDTDSRNPAGTTQDQYNRRLEKSIGQFDQTHAFKISTVYELPFGRGKRFLASSKGIVNAVFGGWRASAIQQYAGGYPIRVTRNNPLPIFNTATNVTITSYDNWRAPIHGDKFDPAVDRFLNLAAFPAQPTDFGNSTRYNPKVRSFPTLNESVGLAKRFSLPERFQLDFRWEVFNLFNRVRFGLPGANLNTNTFGVVTTQDNDPRRMQMGLKLSW